MQRRLKAIHHLDVPWRPADMVQREGRIMRRGNENREIRIYRYVVEGSFDSYSWQVLQTKQHFISQFLSGSNTQRSIVDFDNDELSYAEVKALALSEPLMKSYAEKENELRSAKIIYRHEQMERDLIKKKIKELEEKIKTTSEDVEKSKETHEYIISSEDELLKSGEELACIILKSLEQAKPSEKIASVGEFNAVAPINQSEGNLFVIFERKGAEFYLELGKSESGNKTRIKNFFKGFRDKIDERVKRLEKLKVQKEEAEKQLNYSSSSLTRVKELERELKEIFDRIPSEA